MDDLQLTHVPSTHTGILIEGGNVSTAGRLVPYTISIDRSAG